MEIDHIVPEALGGATIEENLWLACSLCNDIKGERTEAVDPESGELVALFNPRHQLWDEHFAWMHDATIIAGKTPTGRATVIALNMNRSMLVSARRIWAASGWHPPTD